MTAYRPFLTKAQQRMLEATIVDGVCPAPRIAQWSTYRALLKHGLLAGGNGVPATITEAGYRELERLRHRSARSAQVRPSARAAKEIVAQVAERHRIGVRDILDHARLSHLIPVRRRVYAELREAGLSFEEIGMVCNRDHSTIIHALKRHAELRGAA